MKMKRMKRGTRTSRRDQLNKQSMLDVRDAEGDEVETRFTYTYASRYILLLLLFYSNYIRVIISPSSHVSGENKNFHTVYYVCAVALFFFLPRNRISAPCMRSQTRIATVALLLFFSALIVSFIISRTIAQPGHGCNFALSSTKTQPASNERRRPESKRGCIQESRTPLPVATATEPLALIRRFSLQP